MLKPRLKQWLILLMLLINGEKFLITGATSENLSINQHLSQKERHSPDQHREGLGVRYKGMKTRNGSQRCSIYCPFVIVFPPNYNNSGFNPALVPTNITTTISPLTKETTKTSSPANEILEKSVDHNRKTFMEKLLPSHQRTSTSNLGDRKKSLDKSKLSKPRKSSESSSKVNSGILVKQIKRISVHQGRDFRIANVTGTRNKLGRKKYTIHGLNSHQKHVLLKQLNFGNNNGKAYEFRQISTCFCRVLCVEEDSHLDLPTIPPQRDSTEADEESGEDSYVEGEDVPVEATIKPNNVLENTVIGGIRPFGPVDFNGMDDFGPNGELARDIPELDERHH